MGARDASQRVLSWEAAARTCSRARWRWKVVAGERFQVPEYESLRNGYPTHVRRKEFDFGIYRFVDPVPHPDGLALDIGAMDDLYVVRFHAKERDQHGTFRWSRAQSYLSLVGVDADVQGAGDLDGERRTAAAGDAGGNGGLPRHDLAWKSRHRPRTDALRLRDPAGARGGGRGER
jgi:hypothetical protein